MGDIADIIGGGTPKTKIEEYYNGDISWITPRDLTGYTKMYISKGKRNIPQLGLEKSSARLLPKGTILLSSRAPIVYLAIAKKGLYTNQGFKSLIVNDKAYKFLFYSFSQQYKHKQKC